MSTEGPRARYLLADDHGAIMVMGIFMCSCLVASLWYLAGLGDAILYRERLQEAADAVAFSDAALHARGMNLIVLINLIMAVILSLRVALRVGKLVMAVAAAIFAGLGFTNPALWAASPPTAAGAVALNNVDNATKPMIDTALQGLNIAQEVIVATSPGLARAGAVDVVGAKYGGVVAKTELIEPDLTEGLPLEKQKPEKLCSEAAAVIPEITKWFFQKAKLELIADLVGVTITPLVTAIASSSPDYFCDLKAGGGGSGAPSTDDQFDVAAEKRCENLDIGKEQELFLDAEKAWLKRCREVGATCESRDGRNLPLALGVQTGSVSPKGVQDELDRLRLDRDLSAQSSAEFEKNFGSFMLNKGKCEVWAKQDMLERRDANDKQTEQQKDPSSTSSTSSSGVAPMLIKDFANGSERGQIIGGALGAHARLQEASRIVRLGAFNDKRTRRTAEPGAARVPAWAQAEMFYDCGGKWTDSVCNGDDDAMWHFKWRARLRRVDKPSDATVAELATRMGTTPPQRGHDAFAEAVATDALAPMGSGEFKANAGLRVNLAALIREKTTRSQGVH